ncbi:hypothetical protein [Streptomyces sp. NPDC088752]|uniref:hypothetical protein n=1 Tax=Streptomyces sp. NPDC088752 TaxID=3154963 RepID=UPI003431799F
MMKCLECKESYEPEPQNTSGFCSWECFDVKQRPNAPEALHGFLGDGVTMTRVDEGAKGE